MMVDHETGSSLVNEITARLDGSDCHVCCVNSIFELRRFDLVLLGVASFSFLSLLTVLLSKSVLIVDRSFYSTVADNNIVRLRQLVATKGLPVSVNPLVLDSFNRADRDVFLFGTGPSISELKPAEVDAGSVKIGCNSIVKDLSFCVEVGGFDYLCFADPVYHFGVSCYVDAFYRDLQQYLSLFPDTILVFPDFSLDFVKRRVPSCSSLLPVKIVPGFDRIVEFHKGEMTVPSNDNVLTLLMIPIASLFTGNIFFAGFDGPSVRKFGGLSSSNSRFWDHNCRFQYVDLMEHVENAHPSFFRDRDYSRYLKRNTQLLCERVSILRREHIIVRSVTSTNYEFLN